MAQRLLVLVAASVLLGAPFGMAQTPKPPPVVEADLVFGRAGAVDLKLDLARPAEGAGPFPAIVCIHGGGWVGGSRKQMAQTIEALAKYGYVAVAPDYRLAPAHRFPAQVEDCKCAVRWLRAHAGDYNIDPERIGVMGLSAGGHLACLLGVTKRSDGLEGSGGHTAESSAVQAVVSFFGPTDLAAPVWSKEARSGNLIPLLGGPPEKCAAAYRAASPLTYADRPAPPFLFLHGSDDPVVPPEQSQVLAEKLRAAGGSARVVLVKDEGHGWRGANLLRSIAEMIAFFDTTFKKP
jgi:acetyl esterase/lipase